MSEEEFVCPECGEPIGSTSTYCMHCFAEIEPPTAAAGVDGSAGAEQERSLAARVAALANSQAAEDGAGEWDAGVEPDPEVREAAAELEDDPDLHAPYTLGDIETLQDLPPSLQTNRSGMEDGRLHPTGMTRQVLLVVAAVVGGLALGVGAAIGLGQLLGPGPALLGGAIAGIASSRLVLGLR